MKYLGGKSRLAKYILPVMLSQRRLDQVWVEPFVGGANVIDKVWGDRIGNDINPYIIALFKALQQGWEPPSDLSELEYLKIKKNKAAYPPELVGFAGVNCSFGAKWFCSYARPTKVRNYANTARLHLIKQATALQGVDFRSGDYKELEIPPKSLIYCDPPYKGVDCSYYSKIDHDEFWEWALQKALDGHDVFVSEYQGPPFAKIVKEVKFFSNLSIKGQKQTIEKLFKIYP